jgi:NADPH2:quinone reductase
MAIHNTAGTSHQPLMGAAPAAVTHGFLLHQPGPPESLQWGEMPMPQSAPDEALVRVEAVTVNPVDFKLMANGLPAWQYPIVPGVDGAGIVEAVGEGVTRVRVGDRVAFTADVRRNGSFAEHLTINAHALARVPEGVSLEVAAALPCAGGTAFQSVNRRLRVGPGEWVLVNGASGGVGGYAVQLARLAGGRVIGTASPKNHEFLRSLGADHALDYNDPDLVARVLELSGGGVKAVVETAGAATTLLDTLVLGGGIACVLGLPDLEKYRRHPKKVSLHPIMLGAAFAGSPSDLEDLAGMLEELMELVRRGEIDPLVTEVRPRHDLPRTLSDLKAGGIRGKLVVRMTAD